MQRTLALLEAFPFACGIGNFIVGIHIRRFEPAAKQRRDLGPNNPVATSPMSLASARGTHGRFLRLSAMRQLSHRRNVGARRDQERSISN